MSRRVPVDEAHDHSPVLTQATIILFDLSKRKRFRIFGGRLNWTRRTSRRGRSWDTNISNKGIPMLLSNRTGGPSVCCLLSSSRFPSSLRIFRCEPQGLPRMVWPRAGLRVAEYAPVFTALLPTCNGAKVRRETVHRE